jgi:hypothetical protein
MTAPQSLTSHARDAFALDTVVARTLVRLTASLLRCRLRGDDPVVLALYQAVEHLEQAQTILGQRTRGP